MGDPANTKAGTLREWSLWSGLIHLSGVQGDLLCVGDCEQDNPKSPHGWTIPPTKPACGSMAFRLAFVSGGTGLAGQLGASGATASQLTLGTGAAGSVQAMGGAGETEEGS